MPLMSINFLKVLQNFISSTTLSYDPYSLVLVQVQASRQLHYIWLQIQTGSSLIWSTLVNV